MNRNLYSPTAFCLALALALTAAVPRAANAGVNLEQLRPPDGVRISVFADNVPTARHMAFDDQGNLFLSQTRRGRVVALPDADHDGKADEVVSILKGHRAPHGLAFAQLGPDYYLYVAEETRVIRMKRIGKPFRYGAPENVVSGLPGGGHYTRTIKIREDWLYLSVGSSCNVCEEDNAIRAAISRFALREHKGGIFASGLRNTVGMEFSPYTGELWGVNNGRDHLGDDQPREELNIIRQGKHYGWPYCYGSQIPDPDLGEHYDCRRTEPPAHTFTAHMAPLGMAFYRAGNLPEKYNNSLFIAFHGSWNRSTPAGYKVVRVVLTETGNIVRHEDFITGWLQADGGKTGRPVDLELSPAGDLLLSDDHAGVVYLIRKK
ncbi:MAG: PQQ-dependent sugar dehydrogenase [Nitrospinales bacterium]